MPTRKKYLKTQTQYAAEYRVSRRAIGRYMESKAPLDDPEAMKVFFGKQRSQPPSQDGDDIKAAKLKKVLLECDRLTHSNAVEAGKYVTLASVKTDAIRVASAFRAELFTLKSDVPAWEGLSAADMERRMNDRLESICRNLSDAYSALYGAA